MATLPLLTALLAGFTHALEADHMAAVTTFVSRRSHPLRAAGFGMRWGLGHALVLLVVGGALILMDLQVPPSLARGMEFGVGAMLLILAAWALGGRAHRRRSGSAHAHAHAAGPPHSHATTWVGAAHGLAGTAGLLTLLPAALITSPWTAGSYLLCFGLGTVAAMGLYGLVAGLVFHRVGALASPLADTLRVATALCSALIGVLWMHGAVTG